MFKVCRDAQENNFDLEESFSFVDSSFTLADSKESTLYEGAHILNNIYRNMQNQLQNQERVIWMYLKFQFHH